jgi:DNA-binding NarL/FixJ family response regulator
MDNSLKEIIEKFIKGIFKDITSYLNDNIKNINLISRISQFEGDIVDFIKILNKDYILKKSSTLLNYGITEKEMNIIVLINNGLSNKEISDKLCIAEITVKKHISSIFRKLKIKKRTELLNFIINN